MTCTMEQKDYREVTELAHELFCDRSHADRCGWMYHTRETDPYTRPDWLKRVFKVAQRLDFSPGEMVEYIVKVRTNYDEAGKLRNELKYG